MATPQFWSTPLRYLRWASHEKPAIFYALVTGAMGPVALVTLPPIRHYFGDVDPEPIPLTYPSKRSQPSFLLSGLDILAELRLRLHLASTDSSTSQF